MEKSHVQKKPRVFYGYWIVLVAFLCLIISSGVTFFGFGLFVKPLQAEFGWSRGGIMIGWTTFNLVLGASSPFVGRLVDRYGARIVIAIGALLTGLGLGLLGVLNSLWQLYLGYAVMGVGSAAMAIVSPTAVVSNWFKKRRGMALGITTVGAGGGGFVFAPLIGSLLIPSFGWRGCFLALALIVCVILIPLVLLVIKNRPEDMGLYPDGQETPEKVTGIESKVSFSGGITPGMALATLSFWLICIAYFLTNFSVVGVSQNQAAHFQDIGFSLSVAANVLAVSSLVSGIAKFLFGTLCDRMAAKYVYAISCGFQVVALVMLLYITPTSNTVLIWFYAIAMGLGYGGWFPTMSMLISTNFGLAYYGVIFGVAFFAQSLGPSTGPLVAGYMYDAMNTYRGAFFLFLSVYVVAFPALLLVRRPKSWLLSQDGVLDSGT